ncbi:hypothetical protein QR674_07745 [Acinetobacter chinensis]|uniref:DNA replication protein DnaD n=1 Tax=Acinetobacter chinensis TaxID=2004650 RepID=A0ABU3WEP1_9GAMM|nr:hypothetical protein [Acinetobacter chinensis]MDV2468875.1 hypothetical protein [Acinetobacter chinensis]
MKIYSTGHEVVDQVGSLHLEGNIIPANWFQIFKKSDGKPDVNAIVLLSEIVYWYRPTVVRDEDSGQIVRVKKKFKADLLQRSYQSFSDQFGFSKQQITDALGRLESFGVIKRHFRTVEANSRKYNNVLFIELITPVLFEVTTLSLSKGIDSPFQKADPLPMETSPSPFEKVDPPHFKKGTNTETTTEITTDINTQQETPENSARDDSWKPDPEQLATALRTTRYSQRVSEILAMEDFEFHLGNFNTHHEHNHQITDNQKLRKFAQWIFQEFEKQLAKAERETKKSNTRISVKPNSRNVNDPWDSIPEPTGAPAQVHIPEDFA